MDQTLQQAIRQYTSSPSDENQAELDAMLKRAGLPLTTTTEAIRTVARAIIDLSQGGLDDEWTLDIAERYVDFPYGVSREESHDDVAMCGLLYRELPTEAEAIARFGVRGPIIYQAMQYLAACEHCGQYILGCICEEDYGCLDCGNRDCMGDCVQGYPYQVGSAFGGAVAIWVHPTPAECGCRGSGWSSTDYDSWHECPLHYQNQPHPEFPEE